MKTIEFHGKKYVAMPYLKHGECNGCAFQDDDVNEVPCPHTVKLLSCSASSPIWIEDTPETIAAYVAHKLDYS